MITFVYCELYFMGREEGREMEGGRRKGGRRRGGREGGRRKVGGGRRKGGRRIRRCNTFYEVWL